MGDKSPKSKERNAKQKTSAQAGVAAATQAKQADKSRAPVPPGKGKR